ncbi:MAG: hypothetical protein HZB91_00345 [Elusimicrobia bacterium]|nr:hypothetical protein [Elusimicrobiota bacterium]
MNPWFYPAVLLGGVLFFVGRSISARVKDRGRAEIAVLAAAFAAALPGLLYGFYYSHLLLDSAVWFYELRSWMGTEVAAAGMGFSAGVFNERMLRFPAGKRLVGTPVAILALATALVVPYLKNIKFPLKTAGLTDSWVNGVCLQSTPSTCGACSAATIMRKVGVPVTEAEVAKKAYTSLGGTELWYIARMMKWKGFRMHFEALPPGGIELPYPSIAGVRMEGFGHFIAVLDRTPKGYAIGDPLYGRIVIPDHRLKAEYEFTGFFLVMDYPPVMAGGAKVR